MFRLTSNGSRVSIERASVIVIYKMTCTRHLLSLYMRIEESMNRYVRVNANLIRINLNKTIIKHINEMIRSNAARKNHN
jgi:hypothetical protein